MLHCSLQAATGKMFVQGREQDSSTNMHNLGLQVKLCLCWALLNSTIKIQTLLLKQCSTLLLLMQQGGAYSSRWSSSKGACISTHCHGEVHIEQLNVRLYRRLASMSLM